MDHHRTGCVGKHVACINDGRVVKSISLALFKLGVPPARGHSGDGLVAFLVEVVTDLNDRTRSKARLGNFADSFARFRRIGLTSVERALSKGQNDL